MCDEGQGGRRAPRVADHSLHEPVGETQPEPANDAADDLRERVVSHRAERISLGVLEQGGEARGLIESVKEVAPARGEQPHR